jgi:hypothetical protein
MPSHTYNRIGRWGDAVRANIAAWHSDLKALEGKGFAIRQALRVADDHGAADVERSMMEAMAVRYEPAHDPDTRRALDERYAASMGEVYERFPEDQEVGTLYGEALMLLQPRRGRWDIGDPAVQRIHQVLAATLASDITHPGACHLYVHATEPTTEPGRAEACAEYLGSSIPGASHIQHMPSHTYNRIGRWGDAVRANIAAWHSDLKALEGKGFAIAYAPFRRVLRRAGRCGHAGREGLREAHGWWPILPRPHAPAFRAIR